MFSYERPELVAFRVQLEGDHIIEGHGLPPSGDDECSLFLDGSGLPHLS